ncbi:MAG: hypothetical protein FWG45_07965, partial [Oscillospiraceae bacterium]|nr:hypothetical protein [Oscillospiraceae bacterium]
MKENYKKVFELVSPSGRDNVFIDEIVKTAEFDSRRTRVSTLPFALSGAAMIALIVAAAVFLNPLGNGGTVSSYDSDTQATDSFIDETVTDETATAVDEAGIIDCETPDETATADVTEPLRCGTPDLNPCEINVIENSHDFDFIITDMRGDTHCMMLTYEVRLADGWSVVDDVSKIFKKFTDRENQAPYFGEVWLDIKSVAERISWGFVATSVNDTTYCMSAPHFTINKGFLFPGDRELELKYSTYLQNPDGEIELWIFRGTFTTDYVINEHTTFDLGVSPLDKERTLSISPLSFVVGEIFWKSDIKFVIDGKAISTFDLT